MQHQLIISPDVSIVLGVLLGVVIFVGSMVYLMKR